MIALPLFAICQSDRPTSVHGRDHETWQDCPWPLSTARPPSRPLWHSVQPSCITHYTRDRHTYTHTHTHIRLQPPSTMHTSMHASADQAGGSTAAVAADMSFGEGGQQQSLHDSHGLRLLLLHHHTVQYRTRTFCTTHNSILLPPKAKACLQTRPDSSSGMPPTNRCTPRPPKR